MLHILLKISVKSTFGAGIYRPVSGRCSSPPKKVVTVVPAPPPDSEMSGLAEHVVPPCPGERQTRPAVPAAELPARVLRRWWRVDDSRTTAGIAQRPLSLLFFFLLFFSFLFSCSLFSFLFSYF